MKEKTIEYRVAAEGWLDGKFRKKDERVAMTPTAAKFLVLGGQLVVPDTAKKKKPEPTVAQDDKTETKPETKSKD